MSIKLFALLLVFFYSCYSPPQIDGFDGEKWKASEPCSFYRIETAAFLEAHELDLQGFIQKEMDDFLGINRKHQLGSRNSQFFLYPITIDCGDSIPNTSLSLMFDALGRVKEVQVVLVD